MAPSPSPVVRGLSANSPSSPRGISTLRHRHVNIPQMSLSLTIACLKDAGPHQARYTKLSWPLATWPSNNTKSPSTVARRCLVYPIHSHNQEVGGRHGIKKQVFHTGEGNNKAITIYIRATSLQDTFAQYSSRH